MKNPELKDKAVIVCGSKEDRHGIVLAKSEKAKKFGIKTGDVYWQAKQKCPDVIELPADFGAYLVVSKKVRKIYERYTDKIESFGIDECWLDVTDSVKLFGSGENIAEKIREKVKKEIGVTVSIGVSWNKIFAKLGSDMKKPDAVTVITPENYKETVWNLSVEDLLYVGKATKRKLNGYGIKTIGELANTDIGLLERWLGKWGVYLHVFANGKDETPVMPRTEEQNVKSIGNSLTNYRDLNTDDEVYTLLLLLSDSVAARLRESNLGRATTVHLSVKNTRLESYLKQEKTLKSVGTAKEIADIAFKLFKEVYDWKYPVRAVGVSVGSFTAGEDQLSLDFNEKTEAAEKSVENLRKKYGNQIVQRATVLKDFHLKNADIKGEHVFHPENYFNK